MIARDVRRNNQLRFASSSGSCSVRCEVGALHLVLLALHLVLHLVCCYQMWAVATLGTLACASIKPRRIHLVVNPYGGGGAGLAALEAVTPVFEAAGVEVTDRKSVV